MGGESLLDSTFHNPCHAGVTRQQESGKRGLCYTGRNSYSTPHTPHFYLPQNQQKNSSRFHVALHHAEGHKSSRQEKDSRQIHRKIRVTFLPYLSVWPGRFMPNIRFYASFTLKESVRYCFIKGDLSFLKRFIK